jgi:hypothetical protein
MGWARPPKTTKGGGDGEECAPCTLNTTSKNLGPVKEVIKAAMGYDCMCWTGKLSKKERESLKKIGD